MARLLLRFGIVQLLFLTTIAFAQPDTPIADFDLARIQRASVLVMQTTTVDGVTQITCVSSGTIVTPDGLILTNAHGTTQNASCPGESIIVSLSVRDGEPPVPSFRAFVTQADPGLDIALLRINAEVNGQPITPDELSLPFVELADSNEVALDETLFVVGYPGIGDDTVTTIQATVQGFNAEPRGGERSWFKVRGINGDITGPMSGSGAYNRGGQLVGIPTTAPLSRTIDTANCIQIQDTNRDSLINSSDSCVPLGGSINALRPSNFAVPLLQSAQLDLTVTRPETSQRFSGLAPSIRNLFFAPSVNNGMPTTVLSSLPAGISSLYLFFDYENMTPETVYELRVSVNGTTNPVFSLPPVRWSGGERGLWHIGLTGQPLPNGELSFSLLINGQLATEPRVIRVGGSPEETPTFRSITFLQQEGEQQIFGNGYILGIGNNVTARFTYDNMVDGTPWTHVWYFNNQVVSRVSETWIGGENGTYDAPLVADGGLLPGQYRLELYIQDTLSTMADFTVAGTPEATRPRVFSNDRFTLAASPEEALASLPATVVTNPIQRLYAIFDWTAIAPGTIWQMRWSVDDRVFFDAVTPWSLAENGAGYITQLSSSTVIPDGRYEIELLINGILLVQRDIEIGIGQLPLDVFVESEGVLLRGQVIDADTRLGVPDVTIIVLSEQFSVEDYTALTDQIYATSVTDRNGQYQFSKLLYFGIPYSIIIIADGYLPITVDGVEVFDGSDPDEPATENPLERDIYLTRG
jgi:S1-C subfamily serine protease